MISFFRVIKTGITNFWRNIWLSLAATLVMVITLIIFSVLTLLFVVTNYSVDSIKERVDISVYFKIGLAENQIITIKQELESNPKISQITYTSPDQALKEFKERHANEPLIVDSLNELNENPLPGTLQIKTFQLEDYPDIAEQLKNERFLSAIDKVNFEDNKIIIERLNRILRFIISFGGALAIIFAIIAILVIFNTITLTIYNRREEVEIMRLVGATNWYIRGPFMVEALMYSLLAVIITSLALIPVFIKVIPNINSYLNPGNNIFSQDFLRFHYLVGMQLVISISLSSISTLLAIRKYLKI